MTQKQIFGLVVSVAVAALGFAFVYRQHAAPSALRNASEKKMDVATKEKDVVAPVPDTIDGVTADIESESALDLSALDDEEAGSMSEIDADSDSVNNLGTSYDENNL